MRAEHPTLAADVLGPLLALAEGEPARIDAERVLFSVGHAGELLLQRAGFEERYDALDSDAAADERLAIVDALTDVCDQLGDWRAVLRFGTELLALQIATFGVDRHDTLTTRSNIASWTLGVVGRRKHCVYFEYSSPITNVS